MKSSPKSVAHYVNITWSILGWRFPALLGLTLLATLVDGVGLALFIPLFQLVDGDSQAMESGEAEFVTKAFQKAGLSFDLGVVIVLIVAVFVFKGFIKFCESAYSGRLQSLTAQRLRRRFVDAFSTVDYEYFTSQDTGSLSHISGGELLKAVGSIFQFIAAAAGLCTVVTYFGLASLVSFQFTFLTLILGVVPAGVMRALNRRSKDVATKIVTGTTAYQGFLTEIIQNAKYMLSTGTIDRAVTKLHDENDRLSNQTFRLGLLTAWVKGSREPLLVGSLCALILLHSNFSSTPIAGMIFIFLLVYRSITNLMSYQVTWQAFLGTSPSIDLVLNQIDEIEQNAVAKSGVDCPDGPLKITFKDVEFRYGEKAILNHIDLTINPGESVALLGPSGSGKSTLVNLLTGLLKPTKGHVFLNDVDLNHVDLASYRRRVGYITQESVIFNDSIRNNIRLWSDHEIPTSIIEDSAIDFIEDLPKGLDTVVGDRGASLSGGQRQRLCIARELYRGVSLLILDEATSSLDADNESIIHETLKRMRGKISMVLITHRAQHALDAHRIVVLEKGQITENGLSSTQAGLTPTKNRPQ